MSIFLCKWDKKIVVEFKIGLKNECFLVVIKDFSCPSIVYENFNLLLYSIQALLNIHNVNELS